MLSATACCCWRCYLFVFRWKCFISVVNPIECSFHRNQHSTMFVFFEVCSLCTSVNEENVRMVKSVRENSQLFEVLTDSSNLFAAANVLILRISFVRWCSVARLISVSHLHGRHYSWLIVWIRWTNILWESKRDFWLISGSLMFRINLKFLPANWFAMWLAEAS